MPHWLCSASAIPVRPLNCAHLQSFWLLKAPWHATVFCSYNTAWLQPAHGSHMPDSWRCLTADRAVPRERTNPFLSEGPSPDSHAGDTSNPFLTPPSASTEEDIFRSPGWQDPPLPQASIPALTPRHLPRRGHAQGATPLRSSLLPEVGQVGALPLRPCAACRQPREVQKQKGVVCHGNNPFAKLTAVRSGMWWSHA